MSRSDLIEALRSGLRRAADPAKAPRMQAYMKSQMPFLGVQSAGVREVCGTALALYPPASFEVWRDAVLELWRTAEYREERYAAIVVARRYRRFHTLEALPMCEELIVTGAWWDLVDPVARIVGELLRCEHEVVATLMRKWSRDPDLWKRRVSITCQLGRKKETDLRLLYDCIEPNLADREFFIRKAIGWALRDYAWTDPDEVERYVREHEGELSPLSRREARKNLARLTS